MDGLAFVGLALLTFLALLAQTPTPTTIKPPPADPIETIGAVIAIVLALVAAILGYRIIRGGRGL